MSLKGQYSTEIVEVIDENTQKYASTHVSTEYAPGNQPIITSNVKEHSDQSLWVRNQATGKEQKLSFNVFNIAARPGHRLMLVRNDETDLLERIVNLETDEMSDAYSAYCSRKGSKTKSPLDASYTTILFTTIPLVNALLALIKLLTVLGGSPGHSRELRYRGRLVDTVACATLAFGTICYGLLFTGTPPESIIPVFVVGAGVLFFVNFIATEIEEMDIAQATKAMDQWVTGLNPTIQPDSINGPQKNGQGSVLAS